MRYFDPKVIHADSDYLGYDGCILFPGARRGFRLTPLTPICRPLSSTTKGAGVEIYSVSGNIEIINDEVPDMRIYIDLAYLYTYVIGCNF